ncbi:hypothetical protein MBAV_002703 [Candidatus Magnetobacterium bavaricum]|uniref:Uncharacterized protein n=1 Tax=Candidatus Magnetobacterium bavaricum TaxID=29290 RepID=A0A0F3GSW5_9BACT|nr:hypothetical protein MBAV_002703 [Candidatus Magnetobacterium bavaricum]
MRFCSLKLGLCHLKTSLVLIHLFPHSCRANSLLKQSISRLALYSGWVEPMTGIEPVTSSLPRMCSAD